MKIQGDPDHPVPTMAVTAAGDDVAYTDVAGYPTTATVLQVSSGVVSAAPAVATLPGSLGVTAYLTGFDISGAGATGAGVVVATIAGLRGGARTIVVAVPAGVTAALPPVVQRFDPPLVAAGENTAIVITVPSLGVGNTHACVNAQGFAA